MAPVSPADPPALLDRYAEAYAALSQEKPEAAELFAALHRDFPADAPAANMSVFAECDHPLHVTSLAPTTMPGSGKPAELVAACGIDAAAIAAAARKLVG